MSDSFLSPLTAADGENIAILDWPLPRDAQRRGTVLIVHGLGEHAARYQALAGWLNTQGFAVRAHDQYGHGDSGGERGALPYYERLLEDLSDVVDGTRLRMGPSEPLILLGHSMGGMVAAHFVAQTVQRVEALVLSSPAFDPGLNPLQKLLLATLPQFVPNLRLGNGLKLKYLSHDPKVVAAYQRDPTVHDRISVRLASLIAKAGAECIATAPRWPIATLLLYAGEDKLVNPQGSHAFAAAAPSALVQAHCFEHMYHEIFNEPDRAEVLAVLQTWLQRFV